MKRKIEWIFMAKENLPVFELFEQIVKLESRIVYGTKWNNICFFHLFY